MGISQSTRNVPRHKEDFDVVKLSDTVFQRISDKLSGQNKGINTQSNESVENADSKYKWTSDLKEENKIELIFFENHFRNQLNEMRKQNVQLLEIYNQPKTQYFEENQIQKSVCYKPSNDCNELEKKLESCYQINYEMPLKCSNELKVFINCLKLSKKQNISQIF